MSKEDQNTRLAVGDRIRVENFYGGHSDYVVEEFRQCLGVFENAARREAGNFTPLCDMYGVGPNSEQKYISNYGEYHTNKVPVWMNLPKPTQ